MRHCWKAKGDDETYVNYNNDELVHTICIYGGRNNSEVFDDLFFLNIYCAQYANDRKTVNTSFDSMPSDGDGVSSKKHVWMVGTGHRKMYRISTRPSIFTYINTYLKEKLTIKDVLSYRWRLRLHG